MLYEWQKKDTISMFNKMWLNVVNSECSITFA